jgi:hypothetical protein
MHGLKPGGQQQKKTQCETCPVMDISHQDERKHTIHKTENPHEERELTEPGNKTDQKRDSQPEI